MTHSNSQTVWVTYAELGTPHTTQGKRCNLCQEVGIVLCDIWAEALP